MRTAEIVQRTIISALISGAATTVVLFGLWFNLATGGALSFMLVPYWEFLVGCACFGLAAVLSSRVARLARNEGIAKLPLFCLLFGLSGFLTSRAFSYILSSRIREALPFGDYFFEPSWALAAIGVGAFLLVCASKGIKGLAQDTPGRTTLGCGRTHGKAMCAEQESNAGTTIHIPPEAEGEAISIKNKTEESA